MEFSTDYGIVFDGKSGIFTPVPAPMIDRTLKADLLTIKRADAAPRPIPQNIFDIFKIHAQALAALGTTRVTYVNAAAGHETPVSRIVIAAPVTNVVRHVTNNHMPVAGLPQIDRQIATRVAQLSGVFGRMAGDLSRRHCPSVAFRGYHTEHVVAMLSEVPNLR